MADAAWRSDPGGLHPLLEELARSLNETVDLSVLDRGRATIADQIASSQRLRAVSTIGESVPLYCTANGKAFLATMDEARAVTRVAAFFSIEGRRTAVIRHGTLPDQDPWPGSGHQAPVGSCDTWRCERRHERGRSHHHAHVQKTPPVAPEAGRRGQLTSGT
jgi:hypothetical protein